jgi:MFS family permease
MVRKMDSKEMTNDLHHEEVEVVSTNLARKDRAAQLLQQVGHPIHVTQADNARVLRKIDLTILPILLTVYCLQYLDKATLSYASVFGLIKDAHLHGEDYSWLGSIVYVAQLIFQPLIAYLLVKLPIGKFAATMVLGWGVILCCMVAATTFKGLLAARFFLGAFEASVGKCPCSLARPIGRRC